MPLWCVRVLKRVQFIFGLMAFNIVHIYDYKTLISHSNKRSFTPISRPGNKDVWGHNDLMNEIISELNWSVKKPNDQHMSCVSLKRSKCTWSVSLSLISALSVLPHIRAVNQDKARGSHKSLDKLYLLWKQLQKLMEALTGCRSTVKQWNMDPQTDAAAQRRENIYCQLPWEAETPREQAAEYSGHCSVRRWIQVKHIFPLLNSRISNKPKGDKDRQTAADRWRVFSFHLSLVCVWDTLYMQCTFILMLLAAALRRCGLCHSDTKWTSVELPDRNCTLGFSHLLSEHYKYI